MAARAGGAGEAGGSARPPSVDRILREPAIMALIEAHGRATVLEETRAHLAGLREAGGDRCSAYEMPALVAAIDARLEALATPLIRPVFNLTGTVLHTNLGRAPLAPEAIEAMAAAAGAASVEYDLAEGGRGERDAGVARWLRRLTAAEAGLVVNNNAAAVMLVLNALAAGREVIVSRGELIEIGGAFRMPDIMARAGCRLREVGTTNRTHLRDYAEAIGPETALVMTVHPSNYAVTGFASKPPPREIAALAREKGVPYVDDLGSGALIDLAALGLPPERTPMQALADGADLVTFSGDKLLGGPQAGLVVGRADLVAACARNPLKRAMRLDKVMLAALEATLRLYADPARAAARIPALRLLARDAAAIREVVERLAPQVDNRLAGRAQVTIADCLSQIGSGALPVDRLPSAALALAPRGCSVEALAATLRRLPVPVIGRISEDRLLLDLRCLDDEAGLLATLAHLPPP